MTLALLITAASGAWADEVKYPIVYDFEAAANAGENPVNKNGSEVNGQKFYGWENVRTTRATNTLKAACCPKYATYGAAATAWMLQLAKSATADCSARTTGRWPSTD